MARRHTLTLLLHSVLARTAFALAVAGPSHRSPQQQPGRRSMLLRAATLTLSPLALQGRAAHAAEVYENEVIGFSFVAPPPFKRASAGIFGLATEKLAFGGAVSYDDASCGAKIDLETKTLPPGPTFARLDPKAWTADDAAESVIVGKVLDRTLRRFGDCDAYLFESATDDERGFTACTLKKDKNFANHLVVLSAHCPNGAFDAHKADLLAAVESLRLTDFTADLTAGDMQVVRPLGRGAG
jgi:hypothetical protein